MSKQKRRILLQPRIVLGKQKETFSIPNTSIINVKGSNLDYRLVKHLKAQNALYDLGPVTINQNLYACPVDCSSRIPIRISDDIVVVLCYQKERPMLRKCC